MNRPLKWLEVLALVLASAAWGAALALHIYFVHSLPRAPSPAVGRVIPLNEHGVFVYLTSAESLLHKSLFILAGVAFGSAVMIDVLADPLGWRRR